MMPRRIDAHHHLWKIARGDYDWMPKTGVLYRDYLPDDLAPLNRAAGIEGTILVQAAATLDETNFMLDLASQPGSTILGVVGWVPLDSTSAAADLESLAARPKAVSIRPMLQDLPVDDWIIQRTVVENMSRLPGLGLRLDLLTHPRHLPYAFHTIERIPDLRVVINHLSKPAYGTSHPQEEWRRWMGEFAKNPNVYCKLSGMASELGPGWKPDDFRPHAEFALERFGPERVMFGTDWPVCLLGGSHEQVVRLAEELTSGLDERAKADVFGETAARFYGV